MNAARLERGVQVSRAQDQRDRPLGRLQFREPLPGLHERYVAARWRQALGSTMHCVAGDGVGILAGAVVGGVLLLPRPAEMALEYILGFGFGWSWPGLMNFAVVRLHPQAPAAATSITQTGVYAGGCVGPLGLGAVAALTDELTTRVGSAEGATPVGSLEEMVRRAVERASEADDRDCRTLFIDIDASELLAWPDIARLSRSPGFPVEI